MAPAGASTGPAGDVQGSVNVPIRQPDGSGTHAKKRNPLNDEVKGFVNSLREHYHVPGISIGVVHEDETYLSGYGHASVEPNVQATEDTLFCIGSITKSILAASLLHALEKSDASLPLTLDTKIRDVIPNDFVASDEYATQRATLRDALYHRLGYPRHDISYGGEGFTAQDAVRSLRHLPMSAELREKFQYCNMGFITLQHVVETITGKWLGDVYDDAVFKPLGMSASVSELKKAQESPHVLATGYSNTESTPNNPQPHHDRRLIGQGGVISNARDMATYLRAMIAQSGLPLSKDSYKALFTPGIIGGGPPTPHQTTQLYGAGWFVSSYRGHRFIFHNGAVPGFASAAGFFPDLKWGAVILTNGDAGGMFSSEAIFYKLVDDFLDVPKEDRIDFVKKWDELVKALQEAYPKSREKLFPKLPTPPLPHSLPLEDYSGTYTHPGYRTVTFAVAKPERDLPVKETTTEVLHAVKVQSDLNATFDLEHVSGEHFVCYLGTLVRSPLVQLVIEPCKAEFEIGADGRVSRLGIQIESSVEKIWFDKV